MTRREEEGIIEELEGGESLRAGGEGGQVCRGGFFILPYNELAVAQGPKIHQKNEL